MTVKEIEPSIELARKIERVEAIQNVIKAHIDMLETATNELKADEEYQKIATQNEKDYYNQFDAEIKLLRSALPVNPSPISG